MNTLSEQPKSAKRIAREAKIAKQLANQRTMEERQEEVNKIYAKFQELGISELLLKEFPSITKTFIEDGISACGIIKIPEIGRELVYLLSNNRRHQCGSMLHTIRN